MYPIQITLNVGSQEQLQSILALVNTKAAAAVAVKIEPTAEPLQIVEVPVVVEAAVPVEAPPAPVQLSYEVVQAAFRAYINKNGRDSAAAVLAGFGLTTLKDADPEQLKKIHAQVTA